MPKNNYDDDDDDLLMALQSMEPCGNCGAEGAKIPCMSGCGEVFYCSRECNMHHASAHRLRCRNLRCSKFNDSESESGSDDSEEYETDSSAEYETDSDEEEEEEEEEEVKPKKKKGKKKSKAKRVNSSRSVESSRGTISRKVSVDADVEKRIEEKILRRLKKQEEARISQAIETRMREEKANWRDDEMNRIIMEMRERFQNEMSTGTFWAALAKKNGLEMESQEMLMLQKSMEHSFLANPQSEDKSAVPLLDAGEDDATDGPTSTRPSRTPSTTKESSWNNACPAFEALRVVVWKHSFLPRLQFRADNTTQIWNTIKKVDTDDSFAHICVGDTLLSINGRAIDDAVQTEDDLNDIFAAYTSPIIMKFEAADPSSKTCKVHDYTVTWSNGPLGVTLKDDCVTQKIPIVNRLTKKSGSVAVKQNIAIGDVLVAINNIDTIQLGCSLSMSILKKVQLPAKLRFRGVGGPSNEAVMNTERVVPAAAPSSGVSVSRAPSSSKQENLNSAIEERASSVMNLSMSISRPRKYSVNWGEGPLGLTIIPGLNEGDLPVIKKVTGTGNSVGIDKAQVGDLLESMNGIETRSMHFEDVVSYLKTAPKPVVLRFRATFDDDFARGTSSSYRSNGTALSTKSDDSMHSGYGTAPNPAPIPSHHATEIVRQVSREAPSNVYKVVWGSGSLGLTIDAKPDTGAFIKRIASLGAAAHLSQDCIGDDFTHINDMDVTRVAFQEIVAHLKNVPRPVTLLFRRKSAPPYERHDSYSSQSSHSSGHYSSEHNVPAPAPSHSRKAALAAAGEEDGAQCYDVVWQDGTPLGLSLRSADSECEYPYITRVTGTGSAAHLPQSVLNDCLISIDGRSVHARDKTFEEVMTLLKVMQKPLTLKFQVRNVSSNHSSAPTLAPAPPSQYQHRAPPPSSSQPPPQQQPQQRKGIKPQESYSWRQNRAPPPAPPLAKSYNSGASAPGGNGMRGHNSNEVSRSFVTTGSDRGLGGAVVAGQEDKFSSIQAPFLVQNKLSTGRRQKMLKGLKK
ncbi:hypothetical protein PsorP6_009134 [Peronosclerospora sorghi]|uniref:Uncharacterized protein n=1 Tax=Peronosclerospora sorghi TaxID=230839 RepID=A0ACC0VYM0_9STRA|nr:hypothetical protein PsorP6_009134 [Peronosclerospora sorghi]